MNTIDQIKAEIERRIKEDYSSGDERDETAQGVCASLLSFLDTLKEQPVDLEKEIEYYLDHAELETKCNGISAAETYFEDIKKTARHFAQWGAEHAKECEECPSRGNTHSYLKGLEDGKKEMKEQMMKEAVEGEVCGRVYDHINVRFADGVCKYLEPKNISHIPADVSKYNIGQKVKIIIVKEG